jgi:hypothetical protein
MAEALEHFHAGRQQQTSIGIGRQFHCDLLGEKAAVGIHVRLSGWVQDQLACVLSGERSS